MSYQGIRREPIFDVMPGLGNVAVPEPATPAEAAPRRHAAAWTALAATAVLLTVPAMSIRTLRAPETTGSIGPAQADMAGLATFSIQLGSGSEPAALRELWQTLVRRNAASLAGLEPALVPGVAEVGPAWRLTAGTYRNAAHAAEQCGVLRAAGLACEITRRDGAALVSQP